ncbi:ABC transporter permease [Subtercola lobariae]|uniref:Amino acid ABC transporter permease n=1 Tax=Subtercola lobariae TaxID=1588641 RepID=A0A917F072_9MICO|nr:ABC transporter permease [Subtercola lobariae]GGF31783.1 amino acid ABC transporter permease [Subtercola lobariae]
MAITTRASGNGLASRRIVSRPTISRSTRTLLGAGGVIGFLILWQVAASTGLVNDLFTSSPVAIAQAAVVLIADGTLPAAIASSAVVFAAGFGISLVVGLIIGLILGWYRRVNAVVDPLVSLLYATPTLALLPLITVWFGIGFSSQVVVVVLISIFPVILNTAAGVSAVDREHIRLAQSYLATNTDVLRTIALPGAVPSVVAGIRQGLTLSLIGVVVAEYFYGNTGVGGLIFTSALSLDTADALVGVLVFAATALLLTFALGTIQRKLDKWRQ